jgi:predicted dehydrogenase
MGTALDSLDSGSLRRPLRIAVVGAGYWGPNIVRIALGLERCELVAVCDRSPGRIQFIRERFPGIHTTLDYETILGDESIHAVALATPVFTHRPLAESAILAGKHVFVEKPLATTVGDARALVALATARRRTLAVGHIFAHHPAIRHLVGLLEDGKIGEPRYLDSARANLGPPDSQVDVIWDLAIHDASISLAILGCAPRQVAAHAWRLEHGSLWDAAVILARYSNGAVAHHSVSWLSAARLRRFAVSGSAGLAVFDDTRQSGKLAVYDRGSDTRRDSTEAPVELRYGANSILEPQLQQVEPLQLELQDFVDAALDGRAPLVDGHAGLTVVAVLEAAAISASAGSHWVDVNTNPGHAR